MAEAAAAGAPDGLASLTQKRARRTMPPTRHPQKATPVARPGREVVDGGGEPVPAVADTPVPTTSTTPVTVASAAPPSVVDPPATAAVAPAAPARPATVYLDDAQVAFLEQARIAGLLGSPRLDLSKSAVVRLALRRLAEQLSVEEIREVLRSQPMDPTRTGRKKR